MNTTLKDAAEVAKDAADATVHRIGDLMGDFTELVSRPKPTHRGRWMWLGVLALVIVGMAVVMLRRRHGGDAAEEAAADTHRPSAAHHSEVAVA